MKYANDLLRGICLSILLVCVGGCRHSEKPITKAPDASGTQMETKPQIEAFTPSAEHLDVPGVIKNWKFLSPEIDWDAALTLAELSKLAYKDKTFRKQELKAMNVSEVKLLDRGNNSGFLGTSNGDVIIAFRGTDDNYDWIQNIAFNQIPLEEPSHKFHMGFLGGYKLFSQDIEYYLSQKNPKRVWITGHSLGGAMAACCAYQLSRDGHEVHLVTFGQPRIGNSDVADYLDAKLGDNYLRFMNEADPVPIMPPGYGILFPTYWHTGRRILFAGGMMITHQGRTVMAAPPDQDNMEQEPVIQSKDGLTSMSEEDFQSLQEEIRKEDTFETITGSQLTKDSAYPTSLPKSLGGGLASFSQKLADYHNMNEYTKKMHRERER